MKQLLNTLFVTSEDIYLSLEGENVLANRDKTVVARYPLHTLQAIVSFSYAGASPALMGKCAEAGIGLAFCSPHGRFLARTCGESSGNVLLRREQYRVADDPARSCAIARTMIFGKLSNGAASIQRIGFRVFIGSSIIRFCISRAFLLDIILWVSLTAISSWYPEAVRP